MAKGTLPLRAPCNCPFHCSRSSASEHIAYSTRQAVVESRIMKVKTLDHGFLIVRDYQQRDQSAAETQPKTGAVDAMIRVQKYAETRRASPWRCGNSPCSSIQPFNAPKALIEANTASSLPAPAPQK